MKDNLTIAYMTNRINPRVAWFFDSLGRQILPEDKISVTVVDFWAQEMPNWSHREVCQRVYRHGIDCSYHSQFPWRSVNVKIVPPKPTVWQGPQRLTKRDYFAASNARNTAICYAPDGWIAFVDDLSVLLPGWLPAVREAMAGNYIALGAYKKVKNLEVEQGLVKSYELFPPGVDSRWDHGSDDKPVIATGSWLYGCSFAAPVEALLACNGFDEDCDSMAGEDYLCGMMMEKHGSRFQYVRSMTTLESEEAHGEEEPFLRIIKPYPGEKDASHKILNDVKDRGKSQGRVYCPGGSLRELRQQVLHGAGFPPPDGPMNDWRDGQDLREM